MHTAISVLDIYGNSLPAARHAAQIARTLDHHAELSINRFRSTLTSKQPPPPMASTPNVITTGTLSPKAIQAPSPSNTTILSGGKSVGVESPSSNTVRTDAGSLSWLSNDIMSMGSDELWPIAFTDFSLLMGTGPSLESRALKTSPVELRDLWTFTTNSGG